MVIVLRSLSTLCAGMFGFAGWYYFSSVKQPLPSSPDHTSTIGGMRMGESVEGASPLQVVLAEPTTNTTAIEYDQPILSEYIPLPTLQAREQTAGEKLFPERELTLKDMRELYTGEWFILIYAEWCPHSRAYHSMWKELLEHLKITPPKRPLNLATINLSLQPELAALLEVRSLPTFIYLADGTVRSSTLAGPAFQDLLTAAYYDDWQGVSKKRPLPSTYSKLTVLQLEIFDAFGRKTHNLQERFLRWTTKDRLMAYASLGIAIISTVTLQKHGHFDFV